MRMMAMTEPDPVGVLINPNPCDGGIILMTFGEFLDRGFVRAWPIYLPFMSVMTH
jgi:hypothetical protein